MTTQQQRLLFRSAAVFNWLACLILAPATGISSRLGFVPVMDNALFDQVALACIALFGYGYWMAGGDPVAHRGIIKLGVIGKLAVAAIIVGRYFLAGDVNVDYLILVCGDIVYAAMFMQALRAPAARS